MKMPDQLVNQAMEALWGFQQAKRKDDTYPPSEPIQHKWQKPPPENIESQHGCSHLQVGKSHRFGGSSLERLGRSSGGKNTEVGRQHRRDELWKG